MNKSTVNCLRQCILLILAPVVVFATDYPFLPLNAGEVDQIILTATNNDDYRGPSRQDMKTPELPAPNTEEISTTGLFTMEEAINIALRDNPGLAEMQARAEAVSNIPSQAGTLPDPRISFNAMNLPTDTFDISQEPMTQMQFGISQAIPYPGKLTLREEAAEYEATAAMDNVDETRLQLVKNVRTTWWRLYDLVQSLNIVDRNQELLRQFIEIAQTKYKVGQGLQQDVLLARLEFSKLMDLELRLQNACHNEEVNLKTLMDISPDYPLQLPSQVDKNLPLLFEEKTLFELADQSRPLLTKQHNHIEAARTRVKLAEKDFYPDFQVGAAYSFRSGDNPDGGSRPDFASFMMSMNMPIFTGRKQSRALGQRNSELLEQRFKLQDLRSMIRANISSAVSDYRRSRDQVELYESGIIPQAQQTVSSMLAGYQVNKVDFLNLVRAQMTLYNYEISYWRVLSEANQALARVIATVGVERIHE